MGIVFLVDFIEMAKVNYRSVREENRRIVVIRSMFERANRLRKMVESVLQSIESENADDQISNVIGSCGSCWQERRHPSASSFKPSPVRHRHSCRYGFLQQRSTVRLLS